MAFAISFSVQPASFMMREAVELTLNRACNTGSTDTNSSPPFWAVSCARTSTLLLSLERYGCPPWTRGRCFNSWSTSSSICWAFTPSFWKMKFVTSFAFSNIPFSICTGSITCWPFIWAAFTAAWTASCALIVNLSSVISLSSLYKLFTNHYSLFTQTRVVPTW